jgi:phosphate-selective porin OprO/OprP
VETDADAEAKAAAVDETIPGFDDDVTFDEEPRPTFRRPAPRRKPTNRSAHFATEQIVETDVEFERPRRGGRNQRASVAGRGFAPDQTELPGLPDELRDWNDRPIILETKFLATSDGKDGNASGIDPRITALEKRLADMEMQFKKKADEDKKRKDADSTRFSFKPTGQVQLDTWFIGQDDASRAAVGDMPTDGIYFRRARLGATGELWETVDYRLEWDFAFPGRPGFLDNWVQVKRLPIVNNVRVGRYFEPFSLERMTSNRFLTFMERSLLDSFAPARTNGISAYNAVLNERLTWAAGVFRTTTDQFGGNFGNFAGWAGTGRVTMLPYYDDSRPDRVSYAHLGLAYSFRYNDDRTVFFGSFPEARLLATPTPILGPITNNVGVPPFIHTGTINSDYYQLLGLSGAWVNGPFSISAEYALVPVNQIAGPDLNFDAAYVAMSYFLTGESRPYNKAAGTFDRLQPRTNFWKSPTATTGNPSGIGAWELAFRWSYMNLSHKNINGGRLNNITFGLNWYLNAFTRVQFNYLIPFLDKAPFEDSHTHFFGMRAGFDF